MTDDAKLGSVDEVVKRFVDAEEALSALHAERTMLADATLQLSRAERTLEAHTSSSASGLTELREALHQRLAGEQELLSKRDELDDAVGAAISEARTVFEQLLQIDPARIDRELTEIRRDQADFRREVAALRDRTDRIEQELQAVNGRLDDQSTGLSELGDAAGSMRRLLSVATGLVATVLVLVVIGWFL